MNIYKTLNEITKYIDEHLEEKIDYSIFARMMGVNEYTMQRIFSLLTGLTLTEYIRKRRLSAAGKDLYDGKKVMDTGIKYGYDNTTSFSRAFENFHGIKPSQVSKSSLLKEQPRITFDENIRVTSEIDYEIVELEELIFYGKYIDTNNEKIKLDAPKFYKEMTAKYKAIYGDIDYCMTSYLENDREECNRYYVLYKKEIRGFERITLAAGKYLRFRVNSYDAKEIQRLTDTVFLDFLPSSRFEVRFAPEIEYYHDGVTDFFLPIE